MRRPFPIHPAHALRVLIGGALLLPLATDGASANRRPDAGKVGKATKANTQASKPEGPMLLNVSLARQRITIYDKNGVVTSAPISSGRKGYSTPKGIFSILQKSRTHFSNLYGGAPMPFMQRLTWSGVALHAGQLPGYPASHGCIRMPYGFARTLFSMTKLGARVVVTDEPVEPLAIRHDKLPRPLPPGEPESSTLSSASAAELNDNQSGRSAMQLSSLLNVSTAAAATVDAQGIQSVRTRASVLAAQLAKIAASELALAEANARHDEIAARLGEANTEIKAAAADLSSAVGDRDRLLAAAERSDKARAIAERELAAFVAATERKMQRAPDGALPDAEMNKAGATEDALEARMLAAVEEAEQARSSARAMAPSIEQRTAAVSEARDRRDSLQRDLAAARNTLRDAEAALKDAKREYARRDIPVTMVISRKTGKLHVRQGYDDAFSAPVTILNGEHPIGTHVFQALEYASDQTDLAWNAVTVARTQASDRGASKDGARGGRRKAKDAAAAPVARGPTQTPSNALARIEIAPEVLDRLAELVKPGSVLVVTDEGISNETGKYTDLIVLTR